MTVAQNIGFSLRLAGASKDDRERRPSRARLGARVRTRVRLVHFGEGHDGHLGTADDELEPISDQRREGRDGEAFDHPRASSHGRSAVSADVEAVAAGPRRQVVPLVR